MAFAKGQPRPANAGRKPGTPNKHDSLARQAIARFAERNVPKIEEWVTQVAKNDPARAAEITLRAIEYHIPKLGRTELTGKDGEDLKASVTIVYPTKDKD